jgi:hypothetical protein
MKYAAIALFAVTSAACAQSDETPAIVAKAGQRVEVQVPTQQRIAFECLATPSAEVIGKERADKINAKVAEISRIGLPTR